MTREFLSETQARKMRGVLAAIDEGLRQGAAARLIGIPAPRLAADLALLAGSGRWPPPRAAIEALLALPVLSDREAKAQRGRENGRLAAGKLRVDNRRRYRAGCILLPRERLSGIDREVAEQERRTAEAHRAREAHWLDLEQSRYGLPRRGRPISEMPA